jgi:ADP-ribose pyrophosphatase YjhB (NUDIX family)
MKTKILVIGVVKKGDKVLMRKKPDGSPPYKQTWYLFGGELVPDKTPKEVIKETLKKQTGINIKMTRALGWDTEIKKDIDGEVKLFIYLDTICKYINGKLRLSKGIEKLEWVLISKLKNYDLVPPSKKLFKKLGYFN